LQVRAFLSFITLSGLPSLSDMLLVIGGGFWTWFVATILRDPLWVLLFWFRLGSSLSLSLFVPLFPVAGWFV
jgi:hypothetical protein